MSDIAIMIVDDDQSLLRVMQHHLQEAGYEVKAFASPEDALAAQRDVQAQVVFTDLKMPGMDGIEFIRAVVELDPFTVVVMITGHATIDAAVDAMRVGAFDFIEKPVERDHLLAVALKAANLFRLNAENKRLRALVTEHLEFGNMIGKSPAMQRVYAEASKAAMSNATVLIQGETGSGKEVLAKAIHQNGPRRDKPFIAINCASVPSTLLESELFGHVKGAFTGAIADRKGLIEEADGGTFFLDEIGDLPLELQPKLLRILQEREIQRVGANTSKRVNVRFVVATLRDLQAMTQEGTFREDLYFRLNVLPIELPPVRERKDDIFPLFLHFLKDAAELDGKPVPSISKGVLPKLESYSWPGNVREIQNLAARLVALASSESIELSDLPDNISGSEQSQSGIWDLPDSGLALEDWTDRLILSALEKNDWNQSKTAKFLNISRNTLVYRLERSPLLSKARTNQGQ